MLAFTVSNFLFVIIVLSINTIDKYNNIINIYNINIIIIKLNINIIIININ